MADEPATPGTRYVSRGRWLVVIAAVMWSTSGLFAKSPWFDNWPIAGRGIQFAFWRALFAGLIVLPLARRPQWSWKLVPMVATFLLMNVFYLGAMTRTTAANAIWLQSTAPFWVFLIGTLVLHEPVHRLDIVRLLFGAAGVGLILNFELRGEAWLGTLLGLASGVTYAGVVLSLRQLRTFDAPFLIAVNHLFTAAALLPVVWWLGVWPSGIQWPALIGFGVVQMGIPYVLFTRGLRHIPSHEAAGLGLLEPLLVPLWVWIAWHHHPHYQAPNWWTLVGGALILTGLAIRYCKRIEK